MILGICGGDGDGDGDDGVGGGGGDDVDVATVVVNNVFGFCDGILTGKHWATLNVIKYTIIAVNLESKHKKRKNLHKNFKETL